MLFDAQAYLPGGSVMANGYGRLNPDGEAHAPVIGGTGIYANARGQGQRTGHRNGNIDKTSITFRLPP
jgi:hypothetical protein